MSRDTRVARPVRPRHQQGSDEAGDRPEGEAQANVFEDEPPPHEVGTSRFQGRCENEHGGERQAVVEPRLEVQGVTHHARHAGIVDDARRQHGIGWRQQCAEQERLAPAESHHPARDQGDDRRRDRHADCKLAQRQLPLAPEQLGIHLEPVAEQDHDQCNAREVGDERGVGPEFEHSRAARSEQEAREHEHGRQREDTPPQPDRTTASPRSAGRRERRRPSGTRSLR